MFIFNFLRNFLGNFFCRKPIVASNLLLVAPFNAEKQQFAEALVKSTIGEEASFAGADAEGLVAMPLGNRKSGDIPLLYSLRGFHEQNADVSRSLLGLSTSQTQPRLLAHAFVDRLRLSTSCVVCLLDLTVTPLPYAALAEDLRVLRQTFGKRLIFVGINGEKLRSWNPESQRTRMQKWRALVGSTECIECALDAAGLSEVLRAVSKAWSAGAAQRPDASHSTSEKAVTLLKTQQRIITQRQKQSKN